MKKRAEAWLVVAGADAEIRGVYSDEARAKTDVAGRYMRLSNNIRAAHVVERDPAAEAVVKAAGKLLRVSDPANPNAEALHIMREVANLRAAFARYEKGRKKR